MGFVVRKVMGSEVETKDFNRIITEFGDILATNLVLPDKVVEINELIFSISEDFRTMEQGYHRYCKLEYETYQYIEVKCKEGSLEEAQKYPDPNRVLTREFEDFVIRAERIMRYRKKLCMLFFNDNSLDDGNKRRKALRERLDERKDYLGKARYKSYIKLLKADVDWIRVLADIRSQVEHVENLKLNLSECGISIRDDNLISFQHQHLIDYNCKVNRYMNVTFFNLYTYIEDFIAMLMNMFSKFPLIVDLIRLEESGSDEEEEWYSINLGNRKYVFNIVDELKNKLP